MPPVNRHAAQQQDIYMSTFDHIGLIQDINESLSPFRKAQPEAMAGFGQLARASLADGALSAKQKELIALAIGVTQHCSGCIGFHVKALHKLECTRAEMEEMLAVCVYMGGGPALMYAAETIAAWENMAPAKT
jgi:AhpD family alkylhydroperoxidase